MLSRRSFATIGVLGVFGLATGFATSACQMLIPPKIMVVMMENQGASQIIGNPALPYVDEPGQQLRVGTESYAFTHPSLANYLDIVSGSNQGVTDDVPPSSHSFPAVPTLADQLVAAGYSMGAYAESLPADPTNDSGNYVVRHNPWEYFPSAPITVKDSSALIPDLNGASPPDFVWYTPNLTDDGHTGVPTDTEANELAGTESFLSSFIPSVQATAWYKSGGQIIIEWDEALHTDTSGVNGGRRRPRPHHRRLEVPAGKSAPVLGERVDGGDPALDRAPLPGAVSRRASDRANGNINAAVLVAAATGRQSAPHQGIRRR